MKRTLFGAAVTAATLAFATGALAYGPPYCVDNAAPSITAPAEGDAAKCQAAIVKGSQKYLKTLMKVRGKCLGKGLADACPNAKDDSKVQGTAAKAVASIAKKCAATTGLGNSYSGGTGENAGSCTLSQNHGSAELYIAETSGNGTEPDAFDEARTECQEALVKASAKYLPDVLKAVNKCISTNLKDGTNLATLGTQCVGSVLASAQTLPLDADATEAINKTTDKMLETVAGSCTGLSTSSIATMFSCPGATTESDLEACVKCSGLKALFEIVGQVYNETGTIVTPGTGNIQTAVDGGSPGQKFLIASGDYTEGIVLPAGTCSITLGSCPANNQCSAVSTHPGDACTTDLDCYGTCDGASDDPGATCTVDGDCPNGACQLGSCEDACPGVGNDCVSDADGMQFVGCGAASDDRPVIKPPLVAPPTRGFLGIGIDGLHFQGLELLGWANDGIFVSGAAGVSFRDILGDGDNLSTVEEDAVSTYAIFPVKSSDVLVETSEVVNVRDAGIYVGQSDGVVMRHNYVHANVSGMELENSLNGVMYGNTTFNNTGGILVFKLNGPEHQVAGGHYVFENTSFSNNVPNFAIPGTTVAAVPRGTGMMVISDDDSTYENNVVQKNDSYGFLLVDQDAVNALVDPPPFVPTSYDPDMSNVTFIDNKLFASNIAPELTNGTHPDDETLFAGNWTWAITTGANGTCWNTAPQATKTAYLGVSDFPICP